MDRNLICFGSLAGPSGSLSARRAWIEISGVDFAEDWLNVALRKESVDRNLSLPNSIRRCLSRSPQGERG